MITETVVYKNFNDEDDARTLNFHISEAVLMENMTMRDRIARLAEILDSEVTGKRMLSMDEIQEIVDMVKWFMSISYGVKAVDGSSFDQDPIAGHGPIWNSFKNTPAYNELLMSMFRNPEKCVNFIMSVIPASLRESAEAQASPEVRAQMARATQPETPSVAPAPVAPSVTTSMASSDVVDPDIDYEAMMAEEPKQEITQTQHDLMKNRLNAKQFQHFMSTRVVK